MTLTLTPSTVINSTMATGGMPRPDERLASAKAAYTTRHVDRARMAGVVTGRRPEVGDLVLAEVEAIGHHQRIERTDGRRARLYTGDPIMVVYGDRYAPDQFEAIVPADLGPCDLVAAGGVAAQVLVRHDRMKPATRIRPVGLVAEDDGTIVNLRDHRLPASTGRRPRPHTIVVVGTSMNSGKTTTAAGLIRGLTLQGLRVGSAKITGTGAGGDVWTMLDAGASPVLDFTAAGLPSTYRIGGPAACGVGDILLGHLADAGVDVAVIEIADGLFQDETAHLLTAPLVQESESVVFAAQDAIGARAGVAHLQELGVPIRAASGVFTASPLGVREAKAAIDLPILTLEQLQTASHNLGPAAAATTSSANR